MYKLSSTLAVLLSLMTSAVGSAQNWIGDHLGNWNESGNWSSASVPILGDTATFDGIVGGVGARSVVTAGESISTIRFNSPIAYTFTGTGLGVDASIQKLASSSANVLFSSNVTLLNNVGVSNASTTSLTFSNVAGNAPGRQFNVSTGSGPIIVNGGGGNTIFNLSSGNNTLSGITSSTVNLNGGTNTVSSATSTFINILTTSGTNNIGNISGGSTMNNAVSGATISGPTIFSGGSSHSIFGSGTGTLNVMGSLNYSNSTFSWDLGNNSVALADFDRVIGDGSGSLSGSNSTLSLNLGPSVNFSNSFWTQNQSWQIFTGFSFGSSPFSAITVAGAAPGTFSFNNGTLSFTAVPEPSSICLVGIALVAGCVARRRKSAV